MGNAATVRYAYGQQILHNLADANVKDDGGESVAIRAITPTRKPIGWRHAQLPTHTITFNVALLDGAPEVDWMALKESKEEFSFSQLSDLWQRRFKSVIVQTCDSSTDTATLSETWAVTLMALESTYDS